MSRQGPSGRNGLDEQEDIEGAIFLPAGFPYLELMALAPVLGKRLGEAS